MRPTRGSVVSPRASAFRWRRLAAACILLAGCAGCHSGRQTVRARELAAIPGLSVVERDDTFLRIKQADTGGRLRVAGREVDEAELRAGDRFTLVDDAGRPVAYRILIVREDRVVLKRTRSIDRTATGGGVRTTEDVVAVSPYNLEKPGPTPGPS